MKLAAIDIGSNAIRLQVTNVIVSDHSNFFKKLEYVRFPLRLGEDVFTHGRIGKNTESKFVKLMHAFKILIDLYEVTDYMACATSAMREAENSREVISRIHDETGIEIQVIPGATEAQMIEDALSDYLVEENHVHIDVGGGSTEINLFEKGVKINSASFNLGSVRRLKNLDKTSDWDEIKQWVSDNCPPDRSYSAIGTGGNIGKFLELSQSTDSRISLQKLRELQAMIGDMSLEERQVKLHLNPDRADVIFPASEIYIAIMEWGHADSVMVPNVGLKDGVMKILFEKHLKAFA